LADMAYKEKFKQSFGLGRKIAWTAAGVAAVGVAAVYVYCKVTGLDCILEGIGVGFGTLQKVANAAGIPINEIAKHTLDLHDVKRPIADDLLDTFLKRDKPPKKKGAVKKKPVAAPKNLPKDQQKMLLDFLVEKYKKDDLNKKKNLAAKMPKKEKKFVDGLLDYAEKEVEANLKKKIKSGIELGFDLHKEAMGFLGDAFDMTL